MLLWVALHAFDVEEHTRLSTPHCSLHAPMIKEQAHLSQMYAMDDGNRLVTCRKMLYHAYAFKY